MNGLLHVPPTRSSLLRLRLQRVTLLGACALLERKRQILAQKAMELFPRWEELRTLAYPTLSQAYQSFAVTRMRSTAAQLRQLVGAMAPLATIQVQSQMLSGVPIFRVEAQPEPLRPRFGLLGSTAELDRSILLMRDAVVAMARLAEVESTLRSLALSLHKVNRQVRTLRDNLLPRYDATIRWITDMLEEQERNYLFQLKRIR
jgi:V/A-type H+-transporting ATPase subunit D